jgi:tartrate dehydratase beta subunit/fumarate hydratase class I family protein
MYSQVLKAGAALILLTVGGTSALAQSQAKDLTASAYKNDKIVTVKTTPQQVAFTQDKSGSEMSPMPKTGNLAMLITGACLAGVAASRRKVAA